jgi:hypothetical protein
VATYQRRDEPRPTAISPTFYPNVADPEQAAPVKVGSGDELAEINFYLQVTPAVCVRGKITVHSPSKTLPAFVELVPQGGWALPWIVTNARYMAQTQSDKGDFQICGVPPGSYLALAGTNDRTQENFYRGRSPVEVGNTDLEGVNISVDPEFDIRGRVQSDPAAQLDWSRVRVQLQSQDRESSGASAQVNKDGTFVMHHVADASYSFAVEGFPPEFYLKSARLGGADLLASGLVVNYGMSSENLQVVLSPNGGRVDGSVLADDAPVADAEVVSVPDEAHRNRDEYYRSTRSGAMGKFTILGLPPGDFTLYAFERIGNEPFKDPDFLKRFAGQGTTVHIEEQKRQSVQLHLIHKSDRTD